MGKTAKKPEDMTWADIKAIFAEAAMLSKENEKSMKALDAKLDRMAEEREKEAKEREKSYAELKESIAKTEKAVFGVNSEVKGIAKSNNMMSEGFLFESLNAIKTIGGVHFDIVSENIKGTLKRKDGSKLEGQYDVVMINDNAVCIVEVKYRLRPDDVREIVNRHVNTFKELFPRYEKYKFYLAVGGMTVEKEAINTAKNLGVAVLRTKGGALHILDKNMKAY